MRQTEDGAQRFPLVGMAGCARVGVSNDDTLHLVGVDKEGVAADIGNE